MSTRFLGGLLATALGLGIVVAYQAMAPVSPIAEPPPQSVALRPAPLPLPPAYVPPPPERFAIINLRPVFDPARQPVLEPEQTGPRSFTPPDLSLVGVAIASQVSIALLKKPMVRAAISVPLGQSIDGWKLVTVGPDFVVLHAGATDFTIKLRSANGLPQPRLNAVQPPPVTGQPGP
jgi:hypothetical protein